MKLDSKIPSGPLDTKWERFCSEVKLVSPANKRKFDIIVVGTGLAGASASATLAQLGYNVKTFCLQDSPRRAHSIAAQGGINAAKNYQCDGDSVWRLFYDTIKGGDFRAREANVYRLAELSVKIIDHCVAQGVPFAREYGGLLANRSFGGVLVSRTFYAKGQTGQQLLLGAYSQMMRWVAEGQIQLFPKREMMDLVVIDGKARGIIARNLITGEIESYSAHAVILATGGYGNLYCLSTNGRNSNVSAIWKAHKRGAFFANPCFVQAHPTCIPVSGKYQSKLTLMSESLRNDGRVWVPKDPKDKDKPPNEIPVSKRDYFLERLYPTYGNLVPRDVASRAIKRICDEGKGVGPTGQAVYLDLTDAIKRYGREVIERKYGNLFDMYEKITGQSPYEVPMMIYPAVHYTMGGLWVDYTLMTTIPGLFALGEANFSDHGANRLGASALMQGLADGYFIIPYTLGGYLAGESFSEVTETHPAFRDAKLQAEELVKKLLSLKKGRKTVDQFHRELGRIMWDYCGIEREDEKMRQAKQMIYELQEEFWKDGIVPGSGNTINQSLEKAMRLVDYFEFAQLVIDDALSRRESCGCHFNVKYQTEEHEAKRDDQNCAYVAAWEYQGPDKPEVLHKEELKFEFVKPAERSYK
jgi:succinate dehydrogenase / fumarate reductase flavoprotein subunit